MPSKLTKDQIKAELDKAGVEYDPKALKADLEKLYENEVLNAEPEEEPVEEPEKETVPEKEEEKPAFEDSPMVSEKPEPVPVPENKPVKPSENLSWQAMRSKLLHHKDMFVRRTARRLKTEKEVKDFYAKVYD